MTIQTSDIDNPSGDAVDLTLGDSDFFTVAANVILLSEPSNGIDAKNTTEFLIYNYGDIVADLSGVAMEYSNDHLYNETGGSIFGYIGVLLDDSGHQTVVNYGDISGSIIGVDDSLGGNVISNYGTIEGPLEGLNLFGADYVTNAGLISTDNGVGIFSSAASALTTILNTGKIEGDEAIATAGAGALILTNTGALDGAVILGNSGDDTFTNTGAIVGNVKLGGGTNSFDNRHGGTVSGTITGGTGVDTIHLGNDGETVDGGGGHDKLYAGAGADTFVLSSDLGAAWVHIFNFDVANDSFELEHSAFTKLAAGVTPKFSIATAATSATDYLYYNSSTGDLYYDPNGNASGGVHLIAELGAGLKLTASNFRVV